MRLLRPFSTLLIAMLCLAGCSGAQRAIVDPPAAPAEVPAAVATPVPADPVDRVVPYPVTLPREFVQAVEEDTRTAIGLPGRDYWQQETDYALTARLFPDRHRLEGSGRILYTNHSPDSLYMLHLELAQNLHRAESPRNEPAEITGGIELQRVSVGGLELETNQGRGPSYVVNGTQLTLVPTDPVAPGETTAIELDWSFQIPQEGAGGRMGYSRDNLFYLAYWYPVMSVYDDVEGWHTDAFLGRTEFYYGFGDYDVTIEAPAQWLVWATGALQNPDDVLAPDVLTRMQEAHASDEPVMILTADDYRGEVTRPGSDRVTWRFSADRVRDFAFSAMQDYNWMGARAPVTDRDGDGEMDYADINSFYRDTAPLWKDVTLYQQHALTLLSQFTGFPYPWPHMTAVEGAGIIGGGMEFPMMTLIGDYNFAGSAALYGVTAHELAHMWVPMIVATDERRYSWMDEGLTEFAEVEARMEAIPGPNHLLAEHRQYLATARQGDEGEIMRWADFQYTPEAYYTATYGKPASLLAALRAVLGEDTFYEGYRDFIQTWAFKHPYPYDFFNTFERVSGQDLDWFWRSWYYETWTLDQAVADVDYEDGTAQIVIEDRGLVPMPVDLSVTLSNGRTIERRIPVETWLEGVTRTTLTLETDAPVTRVEIDPALNFPDIDRDNNVWTRS